MRTLSIPSLKLLLVLSVAPALAIVNTGCSGESDKPADGDDDDIEPTADGDDDDDDDDDTTDSFYYPDTGLAFVTQGGAATIDLKAGTWTGTENFRVEGFPNGDLCSITNQTQDAASSALSADAGSIPMDNCSLDFTDGTSEPCTYTFEVARTDFVEDAGSDCDVWGVDVNVLEDRIVGIGVIDDIQLGTYTTGAPFISDLLMYYYSGSTTGGATVADWYFHYGSLQASYYEGYGTEFDGSSMNYYLELYAFYYYL